MTAEQIQDIYELSPAQQGMLFHTIYAPEAGEYFTQTTCALHGPLDPAAFEGAWRQVLDRHPVLRTSFHWESLEKPLQVVHREVTLPWVRYDWRGLSRSEQEARLQAYLHAD